MTMSKITENKAKKAFHEVVENHGLPKGEMTSEITTKLQVASIIRLNKILRTPSISTYANYDLLII